MRIGGGTNSIKILGQLSRASNAVADSYQRLSSGMRINKASDDAAGLSIATSLGLKHRVTSQALLNINDGISLLNVADGALSQMSSVVDRLSELAASSANGPLGVSQRASLQREADQLVSEYNRILASTSFNRRTLLGGDLSTLRIQAGFGTQGSVAFGLGNELSRSTGSGSYQAFTTQDTDYSVVKDLVTGDFNHDGYTDVVVVSNDGVDSSIQTFRGSASGTLTPGGYGDDLTGEVIRDIEAGDFNGDGNLDLAYLDSSGLVTITFLNSSGTWAGTGSVTMSSATQLLAADFNQDGRADLAANNGNSIGVRLAQAGGTFGSYATFATGSGAPTAIQTGDFNGDGQLDLLGQTGGSTLVTLLGNGQGSFGAAASTSVSGFSLQSGAVGDFNRDGKDDVVLSNGTSALAVFTGRENGTFTFSATLTVPITNGRYTVADANGDGLQDIIALHNSGPNGYLTTFSSNLDGTFSSPVSTRLATAVLPTRILSGDFNGDGALDVTSDILDGGNIIGLALGIPRTTTATSYINILSPNAARDALDDLTTLKEALSKERASLGASLSRLQTNLSALQSSALELKQAQSRVTDADIAQETASLVKNEILQRTAAALLAQANQMPQIVLALLGQS